MFATVRDKYPCALSPTLSVPYQGANHARLAVYQAQRGRVQALRVPPQVSPYLAPMYALSSLYLAAI